MFFYGEGVDQDYDAAHYWFHLAAEEGDSRSQRNLGLIHSRALPRIPEKFYDPREANLWFSLSVANPENPKNSPLAAKSYEKFLPLSTAMTLRRNIRGQSGETVYLGLCAGCHGFNGIAAYPGAPPTAKRFARVAEETAEYAAMTPAQMAKRIQALEKEMYQHAKNLEFEEAARVRDEIKRLQRGGMAA